MRSSNPLVTAGSLAITCIMLGSCDFPYRPQEFVAPTPPVPLYTFIPQSALRAFVGTTNVKIVFCRTATGAAVYYVDYNDSTLPVNKLKMPAGYGGYPSSPLLSPDGQWVVYFVFNGPTDCAAFVQKLDPNADPVKVGGVFATDPHWWKDPSDNSLYIIYSDLFNPLQLTATTGNSTFKQKVNLSGTTPMLVGAAQNIADKPMNGGLSKDGRYLCTGYNDAAFYNTGNGELIRIDTGLQTCNPSMTYDTTADSTPRMMFLCFSGVQNLNGLGSLADVAVNQHEYIFVVDTLNTVQWYMQKLDGYGEWQDPEWSNNPGFAAALLGTPPAGKYDGVIIRRSDKATLKVMASDSYDKMDNTSKPFVWIGQ